MLFRVLLLKDKPYKIEDKISLECIRRRRREEECNRSLRDEARRLGKVATDRQEDLRSKNYTTEAP
jgi:hypothetical protein